MKIDMTKASVKFLDKLQPKQFRQIVRSIFKLRESPIPHDAKKLAGYSEYQRIDIGEFRIVYRVENDVLKIAVIGKRNDDEVYKKFARKKL
jgi:mRNA interferase RelE/StbE